jgi:hypothetical protein
MRAHWRCNLTPIPIYAHEGRSFHDRQMSQRFGGAGGIAVDAGMIVTVSILSRRTFWTFAYIATTASPRRMTIINLTPMLGAREGSAALFNPFEESISSTLYCSRVSCKASIKRKRGDRIHDALTESPIKFLPGRLKIGGGKINWFAYYDRDGTSTQPSTPAR